MKRFAALLLTLVMVLGLAACGPKTDAPASSSPAADLPASATPTDAPSPSPSPSAQVAGQSEMAEVTEVVEPGMTPISGDALVDGTYEVTVSSSSSMFKIESCALTVSGGQMTATMTMGGTGYLYLYMGTGEEAAAAGESDYIPFVEDAQGKHTFTVPVEALDAGVDCAAFSKKKEKWYDRTLLFRADSLPAEAFAQLKMTTAADLDLADGVYLVDVTLVGGSGKTSVNSPAQVTVKGGEMTATVVMSSKNYDYMLVDGTRYDATATDPGSTFDIPLAGMDWKMPITADTTAMGTPHEIDYTLFFDSATLKPAA